MKFIDEYRDGEKARQVIEEIHRQAVAPMRLMEVCGTHTVSIARCGLRKVLPETVELISGPGCPVCVTGNRDLDRAIALTGIPDALVATFGDMMRVPGSASTLAMEKASGRDVRVVYSPLDGLKMAEEKPKRKIIFLGVGFETTAPTVAATVLEARKGGVKNFWVFSMHKTVPLALKTLLDLGEIKLDGFLLPGHVSAIIGSHPYEFLAKEYGLACVISGFEPLDILQSILMLVRQGRSRSPRVEIQYRRGVNPEGNLRALQVMRQVFEPSDAEWRGLGIIPGTGLTFRRDLAEFDACGNFELTVPPAQENRACRCGDVLRGLIRPQECPLYAGACAPKNPVGPCMVSSEGSCAAAYKYDS
ncbi:MAG: hydrogenase formation protein HypD [Deltaproteobacteria bacterium]|nr:hydrogenase formation protein HypD [Deltaproteobacteria bacterium]